MSSKKIAGSRQKKTIPTLVSQAKKLVEQETLFPIIGIGASAGGLEAIETFFEELPQSTGAAFVVIQHLSPDFKSYMPEILRRKSEMEVEFAEEGKAIKPNCVFLIPPKKNLILAGGKFRLEDIDRDATTPNKPIDLFFKSLAKEKGPKAMAIIFSGTGSDGSIGIKSIHDAGGKVIVQSQESSRFDGMPKNAIATHIVDDVLPPHLIPQKIMEFANQHSNQNNSGQQNGHYEQILSNHSFFDAFADKPEEVSQEMLQIFQLIQERYDVDFSQYKLATISRRFEKRIQALSLGSIADYLEHVQTKPGEISNLYYDLLIGVTAFFRDKEAFQKVETQVIPFLLRNKKNGDEVRIWTPGCASGEEVYSLAILFHEYAQLKKVKLNFKFFATDVDDEILRQATHGVFTQETLKYVRSDFLKKYFSRKGSDFQIIPKIRKSIVFSRHNVLSDPPFTKLDMVVCRNLLIYLESEAQKSALSIFYFSLINQGYLFLGPSESLGRYEVGYEIINRKWRLFKKAGENRLPKDMQLPYRRLGSPLLYPSANSSKTSLYFENQKQVQNVEGSMQILLQKFVPPSLLINEKLDILHSFGEVGKLLHLKPGAPAMNLNSMVNENICAATRISIQRSKKINEPVDYRDLTFKENGKTLTYDLSVFPIHGTKDKHEELYLVSLKEVEIKTKASTKETRRSTIKPMDAHIEHVAELENELQNTKENLQTTIEELETTNEELQSTNEELLSSNEELQSTNEELHSVNEELYTVNSEYQKKIEELTQLTKDEENLLKSTGIGTIFLNKDLTIRKFTPKAAETFHLLPQDIGRPIDHINHNLKKDIRLLELIKKVILGKESIEKEVQTQAGKWFLLRIHAYPNDLKEVEGVVLTFIEVTLMKEVQLELKKQKNIFESLQDLNSDGWWDWDLSDKRKRKYISPRFKEILGYQDHELPNSFKAWQSIIHPDDLPKVLENLERHIRTKGHYPYLREIRYLKKDGDYYWMICRGQAIQDENGEVTRMIGIHTDINASKALTTELRRSNQELEQFAYIASHDLSEPLRTISSYGSILEQDYADNLDRAGNKAVSIMRDSCMRMKNLIDNLLEYSHVMTKEQSFKPVDLFQILSNIRKDFTKIFSETKASLTFAKKLPAICGDPHQIYQLFANLVNNSLKFVTKGQAPKVKITASVLPNQNIQIEVSDNGIGIEKHLSQQIFRPFVKAHNESFYKGVGMGLAICKKIVERHKGQITVVDKKGTGSKFRIILPGKAL